MKVCKKCGKFFERRQIIDGKQHDLHGRIYCLECSPFESYRRKGSGKPKIKKTPETDLRCKYNWAEIQRVYNSGLSLRECQGVFGFGHAAYIKAKRRGVFSLRTLKEAKLLGLAQGKFKQNWSLAAREKQSAIAKRRKLGGKRNSHKIEYKGIILDSSYELRVAQILDRDGIKWTRPSETFEWADDKGVSHRYHPDLYLPELNLYLDPKHKWLIQKDIPKFNAVILRHKINLKMVPIETIKQWELSKFEVKNLNDSGIILT